MDECRAKFQPELVCGGATFLHPKESNDDTQRESIEGQAAIQPKERHEDGKARKPNVKEVYFAGSHSDV